MFLFYIQFKHVVRYDVGAGSIQKSFGNPWNKSGQGDCLKINEQTEDFITTHPQESSSKLAEEVDVKTFVLDEPSTLGHIANLSGWSSSFSL